MKSRWLLLSAVAAVLVAAAFLLQSTGPGGFWPPCLFHKFTGLHCVGCGMTRATHAALHGNFAAAFRYNPVGVVLLPLAAFCVAVQAVYWARDRPVPFRFITGARLGWILAVVVITFWILRNLPWWPFTLLAPPG